MAKSYREVKSTSPTSMKASDRKTSAEYSLHRHYMRNAKKKPWADSVIKTLAVDIMKLRIYTFTTDKNEVKL